VSRSPVWETSYTITRRKHHHRCVACNRIIATGEQVLMGRPCDRDGRLSGTKAVHVACADLAAVPGGAATYREWLTLICTAQKPLVRDIPLSERIRLRRQEERREAVER